ncbi:Transmembrane protein 53 [Diplodia seriata]|uniref:Transmembrane protein 53 n=1 Tax=Diplodia seriata TaxID=420778 RepID=A0A1S8B9L1_9PEZI|nr:Transmembrane protein 53 [Diplodia seriata]
MSTTPTPPAKSQAPDSSSVPGLPDFQRLNHKTYLYDPATCGTGRQRTTPGSSSGTDTPSLILVCSWMDALPRHVAKYTTYYRTLYPASPILLVTSATADFFFNTSSRQRRELAPALAAIRSYVPAPPTTNSTAANGCGGGLLVHALSNGGCGHLAMLSAQYRHLTNGAPLPARSIIYDSAPGRSRFAQGLAAMSLSLPPSPFIRLPLQLVLAVLLVLCFHVPPLFGVRTAATSMRDVLNDAAYVCAEAPRLYVYSSADAVILAGDVEEHAEEARARGLRVERAVFEGSAHVGHMRMEPERYWELVATAWERRTGGRV